MRGRLSPLLLLLCASMLFAETFDYHTVRGRRTKLSVDGVLEGETHLSLEGRSRVQRMSGFGRGWSGDHHLLWDGTIGQSMSTTFRVEEKGRYRFAMRLTKAPDYGIFSIHLDGKQIHKGVDLYSRRVELDPIRDLGEVTLNVGAHRLVFKLVGANRRAVKFRKRGYLMGLDYLKLTRLDPPPKREPIPPVKLQKLSEIRPVIRLHCGRCHWGEKKRGEVNFEELKTKADFIEHIELTQKAIKALETHAMPPRKELPLSAVNRTQITTLLRSFVDEHLQSKSKLSPTILRRMNRYEHNNAVRDLLKLKGDLYPLPEKIIRARPYFNPASGRFPDAIRVGNRALGKAQVERQILTGVVPFGMDRQAEHGFDNRGSERSFSPILLESFLKLGQSIVHSREFDNYTNMPEFFQPPKTDIQIGRDRLRPFLTRAFRAPVSDATLKRYLAYFERDWKKTKSFTKSMKNVVAAILTSPRFLYQIEKTHDLVKEERVNDYELATRLSFFLWSSIPDAELLKLADKKQLSDPKILSQQIDRMLEDPKSQSLSENFARQWLRLSRLITAVPDFDRFGIYYSRIGCEQFKFGCQTMIEPLLLFESIMVEDRSIMLLVDSNYSYRSDELHAWYNAQHPFRKRGNRSRFNPFQQVFKRHKVATRRQGGVITTSSVLTMTSSPLRTSPITRGAWVAEVIFNRPPPPPPDTVPAIEADDAAIEKKGLTLRQRLIQHQTKKSCVSCHSRIDPLGFALENYDAIGRWRDKYRSGLPIDASGVLFGKEKFKDIIGFKDAILRNPEWFIRAFSEHLLSYALGRKLTLSDKPAVDRIVRQGLRDRGKFTTIVRAIAMSYPFLHKTSGK